jgi:hypothetical protein
MNPAIVLGETINPTTNAKRKTGFERRDFMADEVFVTAFPKKENYYHQSSFKSTLMFVPVAGLPF